MNARAYASTEKPAMPAPAVAPGTPGVDAEAEMWALIKESNNTQDVKSFLESFPQGRLAPVARLKLQQLERIVAHRGEQGVRNADPKAAPAPPSSGPKLAIFPGCFENDGKKAYGKSLDLIGDLLLQSKMFSQIQSCYLFKDNPGIGKLAKELNPEALWKKGSIFSLPEPQPQQVCEEAKAPGVDAVLMYHVDVQRGGSQLAVYAVDVKKQKVHVAKESSIMWRLDGDHVTKVLTEKVLAEYKGEK